MYRLLRGLQKCLEGITAEKTGGRREESEREHLASISPLRAPTLGSQRALATAYDFQKKQEICIFVKCPDS